MGHVPPKRIADSSDGLAADRSPRLAGGLVRLLYLAIILLAATANAGVPVSVQLIWKHQFEFAAFYAAQEKGYYRDAGLDVTLREGGPGIDAVREVVEGRSDFGLATSSLVVERYKGKPVVALATLMQHSPIALLARRANGVGSVHDLVGRTVAVDPHSRDEIEAYLKAVGIAVDKVRIVDQSDWTLKSLDENKEAAKVVYVSNETFLIRGREHEYLLLTPRSAGIDLFGNVLFTSEAMAAKHAKTANAFRQATLRGLVYALSHAEEIADLIVASYNTQGKSRDHLLFEAAQIRDLTRPDIVEPGYVNPGRWRHVVEVYAGQNKIPADFDLKGFLYDPAPAPIPPWVKWVLGAAVFGILLLWTLASREHALNRELQREIAVRREAEAALGASQTKYRELVENANAIILRTAADGTISFFNEVAQHVFGYTEDELLGKHLVGSIVPVVESDSQRDLSQLIGAIVQDPDRYAINENENITRDGRRIWVRWANRVILDDAGKPAGMLSIGYDITEQHRLELELAQHRNNLEAQVATRTAELVAARKEAEQLARVKGAFLANMSHEIRTPMNGILGMVHFLRKDGVTEKQARRIDTIDRSAQHLLEIINNVLDLSKMDAGKLAIVRAPVNVTEILENVRSMLGSRAEEAGIGLRLAPLPDLPHLLGDQVRIQQCLLNYVANAIKFTTQGAVTVRIAMLGEDPVSLVLHCEVEDTGIGIEADAVPRLFGAFEQADNSTTRSYGGTGLGLAITKRLAELMGGTVGVESRPDRGSRFWFTVRLLKDAAPAEATAEAPADVEQLLRTRYAGTRVLLVDDEPINLEVAEQSLISAGLAVDTATDGESAVAMARATDYALILMDIQMPRMDGLTATRRILSLPGREATVIIAMTANAFAEDRERCHAAGMKGFLAKPFDPGTLDAMIFKWLSSAPQADAT